MSPLAPPPRAARNPVGLDFKDLANIKVSSVAKKEESIMTTAAAVTVITGEEIRRAGITSLPEALRLASGLQVARVGSGTWAISSRGFNGTIANKLLVLIDGRSVYTPLFSGVYWDVQDVALGSIDRIEVIRGPGAAVWGSNAVNGVINIIRKSADETQGGRVGIGAGTEERLFGFVRYGGPLAKRGHYRVVAKGFERDDLRNPGGGGRRDNWRQGLAGFRADWHGAERDSFLFSSDVYAGEIGATNNIYSLTPPYLESHHDETTMSGGNVTAGWTRRLSGKSKFQFRVYYDRTKRDVPRVATEVRNTYDGEFQHQFPLGRRQNFIWGAGYRASEDRVEEAFGFQWDPDSHTSFNTNLFLQDEVALARSLLLTIGAKLEDTEYTGLEFQPNARLAWMISRRHTVWTSISRAVRTPARLDRDLRINTVSNPSPLTLLSAIGTKDFDSEELTAYEAGYRAQPTRDFYFDLSGFFNVYKDLRSLELGTPFAEATPPPPHTVVPVFIQNKLRGESYGFEMSPQLQVLEWWRLQAQYSYLHLRLHARADSNDMFSIRTEGNDPEHQVSIRSSMNLPRHFELDMAVRYVDHLPNLDVRSYTVGDVRVGWRGIERLNLELAAQNLFKTHHVEFSPGGEVETSVFGRASLDF